MSVGKSKIEDLEVGSDFRAVLQILSDMSNELSRICVNQTRNGFNKAEIENKLSEIDRYISKNPVIEKARIEGNEDVKKIVNLVNQEVSSRLKDIELNIRKEDRAGFGTIEETFKRNKTNTMQRNLEEFEKKEISTKTVAERKEDAEEVIQDRTERLRKIKVYKDLLEELKKKDPTVTEDQVKTSLLDEVVTINKIISNIEKRTKIIDRIKEPSEYKTMVSKITKQIQKAKYDKDALSKKDLNEIRKNLKDLEDLKAGNPEIESFLADFESKTTRNSNGIITAIDAENLLPIIGSDKYQRIDWKESIAETKRVFKEKTKGDVDAILDDDTKLLKLFPGRAEILKKGIKSGVDIYKIATEIAKLTSDEVKLKGQINSIAKDSENVDRLEADKLKAEKRKNTFNELSRRQKTTTAKLFGQDYELVDSRGEAVDFASLEPDLEEEVPFNIIFPPRENAMNKSSAIEGLYDKVRENGNHEEIDRQYDLMPVAYKKPNIFSRVWYKITHRETWGTGKGLIDQRKEDWVKSQIAKQIDDIQQDATGDKSWTLTPEQEKEFNDRQKNVVEKAKRKAREDMVKKNKSAKNANKDAKNEYQKLQREDDEDFTL